MTNITFRTSILNIPDNLTPLKLRGYLKQAAADIQFQTGDKGYAVIRLFLPERLRLLFTQKKLDLLLQSIVDKHPAIHQIVLEPVEQPLSVAEMHEALKEEKSIMDELMQGAKRMEVLAGGALAGNDEEESR